MVQPIFANMPEAKAKKVDCMHKPQNSENTAYELMYGKLDDEDLLKIYMDMS